MTRRLEREIEEILARTASDFGQGTGRSQAGRSKRPRQFPSSTSLGAFWARIRLPGQLIVMSIILVIASFAVQTRWPLPAAIIALVAVACFIAAYVTSWQGSQQVGTERRWRGEIIEFPTRNRGPFDSVRRWWRRRRR